MTLIPITRARGKLGDLAEAVRGEQYFVLTKSGRPKAALVNVAYLTKLQHDLRKLYRKTFIDPALLPYTRKFSDAEVAAWEQEDSL